MRMSFQLKLYGIGYLQFDTYPIDHHHHHHHVPEGLGVFPVP